MEYEFHDQDLVVVVVPVDVSHVVQTDAQSIQAEREAGSVDLLDHQSHDRCLVGVFAPAPADACNAAPVDVRSIQKEVKFNVHSHIRVHSLSHYEEMCEENNAISSGDRERAKFLMM